MQARPSAVVEAGAPTLGRSVRAEQTASATIDAPEQVAPGETFEVTATIEPDQAGGTGSWEIVQVVGSSFTDTVYGSGEYEGTTEVSVDHTAAGGGEVTFGISVWPDSLFVPLPLATTTVTVTEDSGGGGDDGTDGGNGDGGGGTRDLLLLLAVLAALGGGAFVLTR